MAFASKSKDRAVANLKKAAEKRSAKVTDESTSDDTSCDDSSDDEPLSKIGVAKPSAEKSREKLGKKSEGSTVAAKKQSTPTVFNPLPGKTLKVKVSPIKVDKDGREIKGSSKDTMKVSTPAGKKKAALNVSPTVTPGGKKVYKCSNCGVTYDIKGSLNKHINRGRCFKKSSSTPKAMKARAAVKTDEKVDLKTEKTDDKSLSEKSGKDLKREALASVLSPKQLRKVNALMDRDNIKCIQCKKQFTALILLSRHVIRHLGIVRYKCKFCLYKSFNQGECMKHVRNSHNKNDAHKFVMNIDKDSEELKSDTSCRGLSSTNAKYVKNSPAVFKPVKNKSPGSSGASGGEYPTSPGGTPAFNLTVAKRLFASAKSGDEAESKQATVKDEPTSPTESRPGSVARSNSICSTNSDRQGDRKTAGIDSSNIMEPNNKNYNISTRNSPRLFDTTPYKRVDGMSALTTRHGTYEKMRDDSDDESVVKKGKSDGYTTIKTSAHKTPPRDAKTAEQMKKEKESSTEKLIEEIFG